MAEQSLRRLTLGHPSAELRMTSGFLKTTLRQHLLHLHRESHPNWRRRVRIACRSKT
jgi:hypothetical protein